MTVLITFNNKKILKTKQRADKARCFAVMKYLGIEYSVLQF